MLPLAFDAHLDLSFNALGFDRDQTLSIAELRERESAMPEWDRKLVTVSLPELRDAGFAVCLATVLARGTNKTPPVGCPLKTSIDHGNTAIAYSYAQGQLAYYKLLESQQQLRMIRDGAALSEHWRQWQSADEATRRKLPVGYILSMEGCDPIIHPEQAHQWWEQGLRTASLAHYGPGTYAYGTGQDGPLSDAGRTLLDIFAQLGMILDLTHTNDTSWFQVYDLFTGRIFASHNNCRALVPTANNRQFTDEQIRLIIQRQGVIGVAADNIMLFPQYEIGRTDRKHIGLEKIADHVEHICQIAGNRRHVAIGSDLDGGYSARQCPHDLDTIKDLRKLGPILRERGFDEADLEAFFGGNWLRFFKEALPGRA
jgi:membrane dipeptidase